MKKIDNDTYEYTIYYNHKDQHFKIIRGDNKWIIHHMNGTFGVWKCGVGVSLENCQEVIKRYLKKV